MRKPILTSFAITLIAFLLFLCFCGCNTAKRIQRLDEKAVNRVNANVNLQVPVVNQWIKAHPFDTSKKVITIPGPVVKVPEIILVKDTARERKIKDSLIALRPDCGKEAQSAYDMGWDECEKYYKSHPITIQCPPSTHETQTDNSAVARWQDSARIKDNLISHLQGQNGQLQENVDKERGRGNKMLAWAIGLGIFALILLIVIIYMIFKGGILSIFKKK